MGVSTLSLRAGLGPGPSLSSSQTSPYLLRLSLKRLEVVGDILQLLLQLRTLTVNILNTAGEERGRGRNKKRRETHRCELNLCVESWTAYQGRKFLGNLSKHQPTSLYHGTCTAGAGPSVLTRCGFKKETTLERNHSLPEQVTSAPWVWR